jgi:hypothetical protein
MQQFPNILCSIIFVAVVVAAIFDMRAFAFRIARQTEVQAKQENAILKFELRLGAYFLLLVSAYGAVLIGEMKDLTSPEKSKLLIEKHITDKFSDDEIRKVMRSTIASVSKAELAGAIKDTIREEVRNTFSTSIYVIDLVTTDPLAQEQPPLKHQIELIRQSLSGNYYASLRRVIHEPESFPVLPMPYVAGIQFSTVQTSGTQAADFAQKISQDIFKNRALLLPMDEWKATFYVRILLTHGCEVSRFGQ